MAMPIVEMEPLSDVRSKQRVIIEFLVAENEAIRNIHKRLVNVFGDRAVDRSTVGRWVKRVASSDTGQADLSDLQCTDRPSTAVSPAVMQETDALIRNDR